MDGLSATGSKRGLLKLNGDVGGYNLPIVNPYLRNAPPSKIISIKGPLTDSAGNMEIS